MRRASNTRRGLHDRPPPHRTRHRVSRAAATPVPALAAVVTLAVAVGVNLAMFGLIGRALLAPPAQVADPARVFTLGFHLSDDPADTSAMTTTSFVTFAAVRDQVPALASAAFQRGAVTTVIDGEQRRQRDDRHGRGTSICWARDR